MTVRELIDILNALSEEDKDKPVTIYDTKYEEYYSPCKPCIRLDGTVNIYDI